jgi:adenylosuccinate synthase
MTTLTVVAGAQFGSEGKGAVAGYIGKGQDSERDLAIRVAGPNAGHTVYNSKGQCFKLRALPVAAVTSDVCQLHIAAGSEVDLDVLNREILDVEDAGHKLRDRLTIHPSATLLTQRHREAENRAGLVHTIGSTGKGIGGARADRAMRRADTVAAAFNRMPGILSKPGPFDLSDYRKVVVEGTQGYGLGLHTEYYPQVTSSDCRAIDFLAMAGVSPWHASISLFTVVLVARVFPIRVAGNSGPLKDETTWAELNLPEERTTVTNNVRRVGNEDWDLVAEAVRANGGGDFHSGIDLALTMLDQRFPEIAGVTDVDKLPSHVLEYIDAIEYHTQANIQMVGTGPQTVVNL